MLTEIGNTQDSALRKKFMDIVKRYRLNSIAIDVGHQQRIFDLANVYIKEKIMPRKKFDDAVHVAICVFYEFDILLSWNFRHLANITKQIQVNAVNKQQGYLKDLFLLNPMEVINENE